MENDKTKTAKAANGRKQKKSVLKHLPTIIFCGFIAIMCILFIALPRQTYSENEKRYYESFPEVSAENILSGKFGEQFEKYIADHIAGRSFFVGLNSYYDLYTGRNGASGIYSGSDGYLIPVPLTDLSETYADSNTQTFAQLCETTGIPTVLMPVPNIGYIMNDKLPSLHNEYPDDSFYDTVQQNKGNMQFLDLRESFKSSKDYELYYKTDHHWTSTGAYLAYAEYCALVGLEATPDSEFEKTTYDGFYGTSYSKSGLWLSKPDAVEIWQNPNTSDVSVKISDGDKVSEHESMFFEDHLAEQDKYPVYLDGNHSVVTIKNPSAKTDKTLLIVKDSYAHCIAPFLADQYQTVVMVDPRYYKKPVSEMAKEIDADQILVVYGIDNIATDSDIRWVS